MQNASNNFLTIKDLSKSFGDFEALKNIELEIEEGELICFLGPSGCGKTTLLRAIAGLDIQTSGTIIQDGKDISRLPPFERDFGIVFQSYALFPNLSIEKNVAFGLENQKRPKAEITSRVAELLALVGLEDQRSKYPAQLSGGQQQRVALARAMATSPGLLLLDEPLSALDAKVRVLLRHEIKELQRKLGVTTIMVTHDQEEALSMADRIVVMDHGTIEQIGTPAEIYATPRTLFVAGFIGEMNCFEAEIGDKSHLKVGKNIVKTDAVLKGNRSKVTAGIRPECVILHSVDTLKKQTNFFQAEVIDMEFLGSFWRIEFLVDGFTDQLTADASFNAVKRNSLTKGSKVAIELPADCVLTFAGQAQ